MTPEERERFESALENLREINRRARENLPPAVRRARIGVDTGRTSFMKDWPPVRNISSNNREEEP